MVLLWISSQLKSPKAQSIGVYTQGISVWNIVPSILLKYQSVCTEAYIYGVYTYRLWGSTTTECTEDRNQGSGDNSNYIHPLPLMKCLSTSHLYKPLHWGWKQQHGNCRLCLYVHTHSYKVGWRDACSPLRYLQCSPMHVCPKIRHRKIQTWDTRERGFLLGKRDSRRTDNSCHPFINTGETWEEHKEYWFFLKGKGKKEGVEKQQFKIFLNAGIDFCCCCCSFNNNFWDRRRKKWKAFGVKPASYKQVVLLLEDIGTYQN